MQTDSSSESEFELVLTSSDESEPSSPSANYENARKFLSDLVDDQLKKLNVEHQVPILIRPFECFRPTISFLDRSFLQKYLFFFDFMKFRQKIVAETGS
jgi:hypothetical protein